MVTRRRIDAAALAGGLALLALCAIPASSGRVDGPERAVFEAINGLPDALEPVMLAAQFLGVLAIGPLVASIALVARRPRLAVAALLVTLGKLLAERLVWKVVQRNRPGETEPEAIVRGGTRPTGVSFVSGHVVLTTGLAWVATPTCTAGGGSCRGRWSPWWRSPRLPGGSQPARRGRRVRPGPRDRRCGQPRPRGAGRGPDAPAGYARGAEA